MTTSSTKVVFVSPRRRSQGNLWVAAAAVAAIFALMIGKDNEPWMITTKPSLANPYGHHFPLLAGLLFIFALVMGLYGMFVISTSGSSQHGKHRGRHRR